MRKYLVASLVGHVGVTLVGSLLSLSLVSPPPAFTTMKVDLQSMTLPEREAPDLEPEPAPEPEPETPVVEPPPREVPPPPPDLVRPPETVTPDPAPPEPEPEVDRRPPDPELPPVTEV